MMDIETFREYCLQKLGVEESFPFDESTLVFKVMGKMFALTSLERLPISCNLKCDPEYALELRETYDGSIVSGYHMSKKHWNTIYMESGIEISKIIELIDHSYDLVVSKLTKKDKAILKSISENA